ncbi:MAG: protein kinase [Alphaproteobacteria bacterium]|nr:protein kinase [Alphaproteobacteria bacterium]
MRVLEQMLWLCADGLRSAIAELPGDDVLFREIAENAVAMLEREPFPHDPARLLRDADASGDAGLTCLALFGRQRIELDAEARRSAAERAWELFQPCDDDPVALAMLPPLAITWTLAGQFRDRVQRIHALLDARATAWPLLGIASDYVRLIHGKRYDRWDEVTTAAARMAKRQLEPGDLADMVPQSEIEAAWFAGDVEAGLAAARRLLEGGGPLHGHAGLYYDLLRCMGRVDEAVEGLRALLRAGNRHELTRKRLALALIAAGQHDECRELMERAQDVSPRQAMLTLLIDAAAGVKAANGAEIMDAVRVLVKNEDIPMLLASALRFRDPASAEATRIQLALAGWKRLHGEPVAIDAVVPVVGAYDLGIRLGEGANAVVYAARHHRTGIPAAVKVLSAVEGEVLLAEARLLARMRHPNVLALYAFGQVEPDEAAVAPDLPSGAAWMAMEQVTGGTLHTRRGALDWPDLERVVLAVLDGLAHAHGAGVLHLDIKPANVLIARTDAGLTPKLADFGVMALLRASGTARIAGTPPYMPPEQWTGRADDLGAHTDIYAVGALVFELVTGRTPFAGDALAQRSQHQTAPRPLPEGVSPELGRWIARAMAIAPADRFPSARAARMAFAALGEQQLGTVGPTASQTSTFALSTVALPIPAPDRADRTGPGPRDAADGASVVPARVVTRLPPLPAISHPSVTNQAFLVGGFPGCEAAADALWSHYVDATDGAVVVRVRGPGRRTLTAWMVREAIEAGAAGLHVEGETVEAVEQAIRAALPPGRLRTTPATALIRRLGYGRGVLAFTSTPETTAFWEPVLDALQRAPCLVLTDAADAHATLDLPPLSDAQIAAVLRDRTHADLDTLARIAWLARGDLDTARRLWETLVPHLEPHGSTWKPNRDPFDAHGIVEDPLAGGCAPGVREAAIVAHLADEPVGSVDGGAAAPLSERGVLGADGRVLGRDGDAILRATPPTEAQVREALARTRSKRAEALLLQRLGEVEAAIDLAAEAARQARVRADTRDAEAFATLETTLGAEPCRHAMERGLIAEIDGRLAEARRNYLTAACAPEWRVRARLEIATLGDRDFDLPALEALAREAATSDEKAIVLSKLGKGHWYAGRREQALHFMRSVLDLPDPPRATRARLCWYTLPLRPDPHWLREVDPLQETGRDAYLALLAAGRVVWGELDAAETLIGALQIGYAASSRLLLDIARDRVDVVANTLASSGAVLIRHDDWAWTIAWWLEADSALPIWRMTLENHPPRRCAPIGSWILERALRRAPPTRRSEIEAALAWLA